ncbi:MAG: hypothetical protein HOD72_11480, partial [Opitutae bacterium]|nr:hypothetical protein [Opitutae bacterium]
HQEAHKLTTLETFINEPAGLTVTVAKDTDQDGLADIDEYALKMREPYFSDDSFKATELMSGKVISSWSRPLVANDIHFAVDENAVGGPLYMIESKTTDLSFFAGEKHLTVTGTVYNNGNYTISLADPRIADPITVNKIYVLEPTDYETPGNEVTLDVDPREKAFDGIFSYPDEKDTDGDGASDGQEVLGIFGGSNPTDPNQSIATLSGKFLYTGIESGDYYLILTAYTYGKGEDPAGQLNELSFESASQTIRSSTGFFGGSKPEDFNKWDTFSIFGSNENDGVYTVVSTSVDGLTVKENITDENLPPADPEYNFTVFFRRNPQRLLIPGSGDENDAYAIGGIPTQLQYSITGFLDTNGNAVLDRLIDPHVHFLDGSLMLGTDFNELNIDLPNADPDGSNIRILSVTSDPLGSSLIRTITWKSIPGKTYRVRYSTASPAGPFDQYILGAGGAPKEIVGYVGQGKTSLIHFADDERTFYRVEVKSADPFKLESDIISFVAPTRAILASAPTFPPLLPGQRIWITGSTSNNGIYTVSRDVVATDQQIIIEEALLDETAGNLVTIASAGAQLPEMDTDADGLTDFYEEQLGLDPGQDTDGDGVLDDSDGDGNPDGWDSDGDGLPDGWEVLTGLTVFANDIHMANNKVYSSSAIELTGLTDVSFDSATRSIRSSQGSLSDTNQPAFIAGQKVIVSGSGLNSGTYTIVAANSIQITVAEEVQDEKAGRALSISSIGGSNLSVFSAGTTLEVKGFTNIGNFGIESSSENTIQVVGNLADEPTGTFDPNDESAYRGWITLFADDTEGDSDGDLLSNKEEFLGADDKSSGYNDYLIPDRLFDGDWTHPVFNDTDGDTIDDGWEIRYGLDPNQSNGLLGSDIGFRDNRVRSISSLVVSGQNIRFDGASSRILSLTNEFILLRQCRQVTIIGSDSNDGSFPIIDIGVAGDYMEVAPAASGAVIVDEKEGRPIMVHGDLEILSNDISFNGNTISSSPTTVTGNDIFFTAAGEIRNLGGQSIMGDDISFSGTTIRSHNGHFSSGTDDISFDAATSEIRSQVGILNGYAVGYPILVAGSANNNGLFIVQSVPVPGFTVVVNGPLQDEGAQNGGNNPQPKVINITAIGGTDLSSFISGYQVQVFGSLFNDGIYTVTGTPTFPTNTLDVGQLLFTESNGAFVDISYADTSSFSNFRAGQSITVTGSVTNNGTYTIGNALPSANLIQLAATGPAIVAEPANPFTAVTLTAQGVTDFSRFSRGAQIQVNGTSLNDGIYNISNDIAPTASQIQVVEPLTLEASGPDLEIFQLGPSSRLDAFNDNENVLINGSLGNDGTFIIDTNGVSPSTLFALPPKLFASEAAGSQITISKDLDSDGLPDVVEYHYNSNPNLRDTDADGDTDMDETGGFFGGSDPTDPDSVLRSINGLVRYSGIETGNIYIQVDEANRPFEENDTGDTIPSDLYFTNKDHTIHSSTGKLPYLTVGRQILISGTNDGDGDGVGDNDGVFTISKIIASKYAIEVDEELVDEGTIDEDGDGVPDGVSVSATVLGYDPILVPLSLGERAYSINGLASDHLITITAFLDANGNGGLDEFADPNGQYNSGNPVEVGKSGRFNLNLDLEQTSLAIDSVTTEEIDGGYYHTVIWNSVPAKQYRVLYSTSTPAGPYGTYVPAANGLPVVITGRDAPVVNPGDDPPKTSLVHFTVESPVWYRVEMVNAFGEGVPETDTDGDGLTDYHEGQLKLDPENPDVDEDGMPDGWEVLTGLTAYGNDLTLDGDTGKILSIAGLITESTTIGFDLASRKISFNNGMPAFIVGQQITVTGSKVNDGTYTISEVATDSTFIVVKESLNTETAGATVTVASFGGTDLSVFQDGAILVIKGTTAQLYDGVYKVIGASMTHEAQLSTVAGGLPSFQNGNGHPAEPGIWLTLYATDSDANPDGDGWEDVDASGNPIWHQYTNIEEYLGADHTLSIFRKELLPTRIFDGDWTHPNSVDTDMDGIDDGWERRYGLDPSSLNGTFGSDLSFKGPQVRSVESISVSGENISFEAVTRRINSLSSSFLAFSNSQWITITGSGFNDGVYEIESVSQFGEFITVTPAHTLIEEVKGADIYIRADREKTGTDISFNGNTIRASRTTASGSDIHFDDTGFIRSLANQNVQGTDLVFALNEVKSHFGLTTGFIVNDISFDAASQQISSLAGIFPDFVVGQQIFVNGSNSNDGFYTLAGIPVQGSILQVNEALIDEARQNVAGGGGPAPPKIIAVASVGGTDLSGFPGGFQVQIMGSTFNDGNFTLIAPSSQNLLQFATAMLNEPAGANTGISVLNSTNLSGFELGQQIIITGSTLNDGTYQVSNAVAPTAGAIAIQFDPLNPLQLQNEPPLVTRAPTVAAATNTNLSMFTRGGTLVVSGTAFNDGTYHINPFIDPTADTIQVQETFINEPMGPSTTILQTGATDLSGFLDNTTILVSGSFLNNGVYTIAKDGVSQHALTFAPSGIFAGFLREPAAADISISRDSDND